MQGIWSSDGSTWTPSTPLVWEASGREGFVADVQQMRRRVEAHVPAGEVDRQLKLGPGGLRDIEFAVQLLQLVHGRSDDTLRSGNTLRALDALAAGGYVGRDDAASLSDAYRFLRSLEHRLQLRRLRRTHLMPTDPAALRVLGRSIGYTREPVDELTDQWRRHAREVRRLHEKLFYRPLLQAVARLDAGESRLTPEAAQARMEALGYADPQGALRHLEALDLRRQPTGSHPADIAAGHARMVRRRPGPRCRTARFPPGQRSLGQHTLVPRAAAGRRGYRRASCPDPGDQQVRDRPAAASP